MQDTQGYYDQVASLFPEDFEKGGGLPTDFEADVLEAKAILDSGIGSDGPYERGAICLMLRNPDPEGEALKVLWAAGKARPSEDGKMLKGKIADTSNAAFAIAALLKTGFPRQSLAGGNIAGLVGHRFYWQRVPGPKREGFIVKDTKGNVREVTMLVPTKHLGAATGAVAAPAAAKSGNGHAAVAAAPAAGGDAVQACQDAIMEELMSAGKPVPAADMNRLLWKKLDGQPNRKEVFKVITVKETHDSAPYKFDGAQFSL